jgi:hypothetical protein
MRLISNITRRNRIKSPYKPLLRLAKVQLNNKFLKLLLNSNRMHREAKLVIPKRVDKAFNRISNRQFKKFARLPSPQV